MSLIFKPEGKWSFLVVAPPSSQEPLIVFVSRYSGAECTIATVRLPSLIYVPLIKAYRCFSITLFSTMLPVSCGDPVRFPTWGTRKGSSYLILSLLSVLKTDLLWSHEPSWPLRSSGRGPVRQHLVPLHQLSGTNVQIASFVSVLSVLRLLFFTVSLVSAPFISPFLLLIILLMRVPFLALIKS